MKEEYFGGYDHIINKTVVQWTLLSFGSVVSLALDISICCISHNTTAATELSEPPLLLNTSVLCLTWLK